VDFRPATEADLEGEFAVFVAAQHELHERRGAAWSSGQRYEPDGRWATVHRHLLAHDGQRSFVAEDGDRIVGFTAAWVRDDCWYFSALFVDPEYQSRGVGRELLELAWDDSHRRRITITEAIQPVSTALYAKRGLLPVTPILTFQGRPQIGPIDGLEPLPPDPAALRALDAAAYGFDRRVDHDLWQRTSTESTVWARAGEPVAYSYQGAFGIGPIAGRDPESAAQALQAELARSACLEVAVTVPGTATRLVEVALTAGLRLADPGLLLLSPAEQPPPSAIAIHSYWLM
jgi:GNAT superfamily N-acetyltransferase